MTSDTKGAGQRVRLARLPITQEEEERGDSGELKT